MVEKFQVGVISSTHGVHGECKVFPTTDDMTRFSDLKSVMVETPRGNQEFEIEKVRYFKNMVIVKFKGIDDMDTIAKYKTCTLWVDRAHAVPLEENENYIADLYDLKVYLDTQNREEEPFGILTDVIVTGANDVYQVTDKNQKEWMLPAIKDCILEVNVEEGYMVVRLMKGLEEL